MSSTRYQHLLAPLKVGRTYLKTGWYPAPPCPTTSRATSASPPTP